MPSKTLVVLVTTAVPLTAVQRKKISSSVAKARKVQSIELIEKVNPKVIGGIRLTIGSNDYDATISSRLSKIKYQLLEKI